ncbi:MAG: beta-glucuronidase [Acetobacteraceae bacterium]|nr:beta-glucuronidase [Acetobacteraceae bacterium]
MGQGRTGREAMGRRDVLLGPAFAGVPSLTPGAGAQQRRPGFAGVQADGAARRGGLLRPQQNRFRNVLDTSGLWRFQLDPRDEGEAQGWALALPAPRPVAVPCSWNDLFDDARDHLGPAWYLTGLWVPPAWRDQRVFLRVGSANYAAKAWVNGTVVAEHMGGHLPFEAEVGALLAWDGPNVLAIRVENEQRPERVPPGPGPAGGGVAAALGGYPATTYDFFPYAGLHRPVLLHSVPAAAHIEDITVVTSIDGADGVVEVEAIAAGGYAGRGKARLDGVEAELEFRGGSARTALRVPSARFWGPRDPHLHRLTVTLADGQGRATDSYELGVGIRTVEVRGDRLLLNGQPLKLTGFGKHEDAAVRGKGLDLPMWIRDYELLRWAGANSYRTSHYPYAEEAMQLADELGVLVINEIPAVGLNLGDPDELTEQRLLQCLQQLRTLVARDKNRPSTIMWSVANEPVGGTPVGAPPPASGDVAAGVRFFRRLCDEARRLDGTRPVSLVGAQGAPEEWLGLGDVVCVNRYYGWYTQAARLDEAARLLESDLDTLHRRFGKPVILTEFGADALPGAHGAPPEMWTEEYQVELLRRYLDVTEQRPFVAGAHVWCFADFKTGQGTMRAAAMNHKGVFTRDRRPKMAAHFLRSRWAKA